MLSAGHSSNHLGEGLRQEPISALAGHHLIWPHKWTAFRVSLDLKMRYVAAYLLAVLGGNTRPSAKDIKAILGSVGIEADDQRLNKVISELNGKDINEVLNAGMSKMASVPAGGAVCVAAAGVSVAAVPGTAPAAEEKKEEKKEESEESDEDMGFGLFD
ncbi:hypothetical protein DPEC_G00016590 [Dallia pectoralis]|uniref:Uncharacterized protein n=1 Tax=Dallia pectoralis TaxID=75939 RepID=A0ACC2HMX2_DALPE|nr:hypothetical protein DPEC_G00016590 [Dallia pectoralis]